MQAALLGWNEDLRNHPELRERLGARVYEPAMEGLRRMIERAVARGEIEPAAAPAPTTLMNTIAGTVVANVLMFGGNLQRLERELVALLLHGVDGGGCP